jgi:hypothetical protein
MLKNFSKLEVIVGHKIYQLHCDVDSPIEHVKEALFLFGKFVEQVEDSAKQAQAALKPQVDTAQIKPIDSLAKENETPVDIKTEEAK